MDKKHLITLGIGFVAVATITTIAYPIAKKEIRLSRKLYDDGFNRKREFLTDNKFGNVVLVAGVALGATGLVCGAMYSVTKLSQYSGRLSCSLPTA